MSGRGAVAGLIVAVAVTAVVLSSIPALVLAGSGSADVLLQLTAIGGAVAVAGMIAFSGANVGIARAAGAAVGGHAISAALTYVAGGLITNWTDTIVLPAFLFVAVGVILTVMLAGGRLTARAVMLSVVILIVAALIPVGDYPDLLFYAWFVLVPLTWAVIPPAARPPTSPSFAAEP